MKKISRRELFRRTGQVGIGGAALAVGLKPAGAVTARKPANIMMRCRGDPPFNELPPFVYRLGCKYEYVLQRPCIGGSEDGSGPHYEYFTKESGRWRKVNEGYWVDDGPGQGR